jgi:hypothetical protein
LVQWLGFAAFAPLLEVSARSSGSVYASMCALFIISLVFATASNHGFLLTFVVLVASITPTSWHLALFLYAGDTSYAAPTVMLIPFLFVAAVIVHTDRILGVWLRVGSLILFPATILTQALGTLLTPHWSIDFFGLGVDIGSTASIAGHWKGGLGTTLYFCLLTFIPAFMRRRSPFLPVAIAMSLSFVGDPNSGLWSLLVPWTITLVATIALSVSDRSTPTTTLLWSTTRQSRSPYSATLDTLETHVNDTSVDVDGSSDEKRNENGLERKRSDDGANQHDIATGTSVTKATATRTSISTWWWWSNVLVVLMLGVAWLIHSHRFSARADAHTVLPFFAITCYLVVRQHNRNACQTPAAATTTATSPYSALVLLFLVCTSLSAYSFHAVLRPYSLALTITQVGILGVTAFMSASKLSAIPDERRSSAFPSVSITTLIIVFYTLLFAFGGFADTLRPGALKDLYDNLGVDIVSICNRDRFPFRTCITPPRSRTTTSRSCITTYYLHCSERSIATRM